MHETNNMITIYKAVLDFSFSLTGTIAVPMPAGADPINLGVQHNIPTIWYSCDTEEESEIRLFRMICTGQEITEEMGEGDYLGTVLLNNDEFVGHIFEIYE